MHPVKAGACRVRALPEPPTPPTPGGTAEPLPPALSRQVPLTWLTGAPAGAQPLTALLWRRPKAARRAGWLHLGLGFAETVLMTGVGMGPENAAGLPGRGRHAHTHTHAPSPLRPPKPRPARQASEVPGLAGGRHGRHHCVLEAGGPSAEAQSLRRLQAGPLRELSLLPLPLGSAILHWTQPGTDRLCRPC